MARHSLLSQIPVTRSHGGLLVAAIAIVVAHFAQATATGRYLVKVEHRDEVMGSTFGVVLYGEDRAQLDAAARAALDEAHRLDALLSNYKPDSEWSAVNRWAGSRPVTVPAELFALLSACARYSAESEGAFDITVGPLMRVWGFYKGEGRLPTRAEVEAARRHVGYRHLVLDQAAKTVRFGVPGLELDPGGIGKGYAVDRMAAVLAARGVTIALISASGSSIYGRGAPPDEPRGWPIPIRLPKDGEAVAAQIFLKDMAVSTSGSYEKFFWADGRIYAHIIDPRSGYPARGVASVSVVAPRTIDSEAWTKPYFINGRAWTVAHKRAGTRVFFCADGGSTTCEWIQ
jgi:FAD:protein FMN transferase